MVVMLNSSKNEKCFGEMLRENRNMYFIFTLPCIIIDFYLITNKMH